MSAFISDSEKLKSSFLPKRKALLDLISGFSLLESVLEYKTILRIIQYAFIYLEDDHSLSAQHAENAVFIWAKVLGVGSITVKEILSCSQIQEKSKLSPQTGLSPELHLSAHRRHQGLMVEVDFPEPVKGYGTIKVTGRISSDVKNRDILSAALSTLTQTFVGGIEDCLMAELRGQVKEGLCDLSFRVPETSQKQLEAVCKVFKHGYRKIAELCPEHIKVN